MTRLVLWWGGGESGLPLEIVAFLAHSHLTIKVAFPFNLENLFPDQATKSDVYGLGSYIGSYHPSPHPPPQLPTAILLFVWARFKKIKSKLNNIKLRLLKMIS